MEKKTISEIAHEVLRDSQAMPTSYTSKLAVQVIQDKKYIAELQEQIALLHKLNSYHFGRMEEAEQERDYYIKASQDAMSELVEDLKNQVVDELGDSND